MLKLAPPCANCGRQPVLITGESQIKLLICIHCGPFNLNYGFQHMNDALLDWMERQKAICLAAKAKAEEEEKPWLE